MSKMDNQRAMREAKYARTQARAKEQPSSTVLRPPVAPPDATTSPSVAEAPAVTTEALCGHRSMNGRSCTRESGHAAKSHRYS